jgi:photosystem II stability/assembly factor-like uncharacterized protein
MLIRFLMACIASLVFASSSHAVERGEHYDVLDLPAPLSARAAKGKLFGIAKAGSRLVAVGQRGVIIYSDDNAETWSQAQVPVRSVLLDVFFVSASKGWAVGHDGVIVHSDDGGETWSKQLDGYELNDSGLQYYRKLSQENPDNEAYALLVEEFEFATEQGADKPFLMVFFTDENTGFAIGAYGVAVGTVDGGATWVPVMERAFQQFRHTFDYEFVDGKAYLTTEMGAILVADGSGTRLKSIIPFYDGSFYTIVSSNKGDLVVAGLRATAFRSTDGAATWQNLSLPTTASINASTRLADGRIVLVSQHGDVLVSDDDGASFSQVPLDNTFPYADVIEVKPGQLVLVGLGGQRTVTLDR